MTEQDFQEVLEGLIAEISPTDGADRAQLPRMPSVEDAVTNKVRTGVLTLAESVDFLRTAIKYVLFDLEATRRENVLLRRLLEADPRD